MPIQGNRELMAKQGAETLAKRDAIERALGAVVDLEASPSEERRRILTTFTGKVDNVTYLINERQGNLFVVLLEADVIIPGELAAKLFAANLPSNNAVTIVSGLAGVFSGFAKPVLRIAKEMNVDPRDVFFALGRRKVVGGQEDLILETAQELARTKQTAPAQS